MNKEIKDARIKAREHFGILDKPEIILHHKDENLKHTNRKRYDEWRPEDLVPMTQSEHIRIHRLGKKYSKEWAKNISNGNKISVRCVETQQVFESIDAAAEWLKEKTGNVSCKGKICNCCKGYRETTGGYHWEYTEGHRITNSHPKKVPVKCIETNKVFESINDADIWLKETVGHRGHIDDVCKGNRHTTGGYHWEYVK